MKSLRIIAGVLMCLSNLGQITGRETIDVTYEELEKLNVACPPYDTCLAGKRRYSESLTTNECNCGMFCTRYDTCCVNSPYKHMPTPSIKPTCRRSDASSGYLIIDKCPQSEDSKSVYEDLCNDEWNGENDIMSLVPVTSLYTHITYKNFFCFRCHEANNDYIFWKVRTEYQTESPVNENEHVQLQYDKHRNSWVIPLGSSGELVSVSFPVFDVPLDIYSVPKMCRLDVISNCSEDWKDDAVRAKCDAYMSVTMIYREDRTWEYRNPHCAICNYEDLDNFMCRSMYGDVEYDVSDAKKPFSFTLLLDINRSDGEKVGKIQNCGSSSVWDPFFKKCRTLKCAFPGYVVKDGKCTPP